MVDVVKTTDISHLGAKIAKAIAPFLAGQAPVLSKSTLQPPVSPSPGDRYLVPANALGAWAGQTNRIVTLDGGWRFTVPSEGWTTWVIDQARLYVFSGSTWIPADSGTGGGPVTGGVETISNKRMPARDTTADGQLACAIAILRTPVAGSYIGVRVNGVDVPEVGDGSKIGVVCYYSNDGGQTARAWADITLGDTLYWNGSVAGFELASTDVIEFTYES